MEGMGSEDEYTDGDERINYVPESTEDELEDENNMDQKEHVCPCFSSYCFYACLTTFVF